MKHQLPYYFGLCFVLLLQLGAQAGFGQIAVNFVMSPRPSPYLSDWQQRHETIQLNIISNDPYAETAIRISASVSRDGQVVARTKQHSMPTIQLRPGQNMFSAEYIFPLNAIEFVGNADRSAQRLGKLPEGSYTICVQLNDARSGNLIANAGCQSFSVLEVRPPQPISPGISALSLSGNNLTAAPILSGSQMQFNWVPPMPQSGNVRYTLRIYPVRLNENPLDVVKRMDPVVTQEVLTPSATVPRHDWEHEYTVAKYSGLAWNVQASDASGRPLGANNGISETFFVQYNNRKDSTKTERPPIPPDRRTVPIEELGKDGSTTPPAPEPELCGHKVRKFIRREVTPWTRKEKKESDMSLEKPLRPTAKTDITWYREVREIYEVQKCVLPKDHAGAHKYGPPTTETDIKPVEETITYWPGDEQVPPKDHWTDRLPK